jgi:hypothetical protein
MGWQIESAKTSKAPKWSFSAMRSETRCQLLRLAMARGAEWVSYGSGLYRSGSSVRLANRCISGPKFFCCLAMNSILMIIQHQPMTNTRYLLMNGVRHFVFLQPIGGQ